MLVKGSPPQPPALQMLNLFSPQQIYLLTIISLFWFTEPLYPIFYSPKSKSSLALDIQVNVVGGGVQSLLSAQLRYKMNKTIQIPLDQGEN